MGTAKRWRVIPALTLAALMLLAVPQTSVPAPTPPAVETVEGQGPWGWRALCLGCAAAVIWGGVANPLLMINFYTRAPSFVQGCSLACIRAM